MKIQNTEEISQKIYTMASCINIDADLNAIIADNVHKPVITQDEIKQINFEANNLKAELTDQNTSQISVEKIIMTMIVEKLLTPYFNDEFLGYIIPNIIEECVEFDADEFYEDPFVKNISFEGTEYEDFILGYEEIFPFDLDVCGIPKKAEYTAVNIPALCCYGKNILYPAAFSKSTGEKILSLSPACRMDKAVPVSEAKGKVLCIGAGAGYFAYMASEKEEVTSVTVVENDETILSIFENLILPQFPKKDKITVLKAEPVGYLKSVSENMYNYCFVNIFRSTKDLPLYFQIKELCRKFKSIQTNIFLEDAFASLLSTRVFYELMETFLVMNGQSIADEPAPEEEQQIINYVHNLFEDTEITSPEQIDKCLDPDYIISLIDKTEITF